jgi:hypothetical protein
MNSVADEVVSCRAVRLGVAAEAFKLRDALLGGHIALEILLIRTLGADGRLVRDVAACVAVFRAGDITIGPGEARITAAGRGGEIKDVNQVREDSYGGMEGERAKEEGLSGETTERRSVDISRER